MASVTWLEARLRAELGAAGNRQRTVFYTPISLLGKGAFGAVFKAVNDNTGEYFAVKLVRVGWKPDR